MGYKESNARRRNTRRHEYEALVGETGWFFVGYGIPGALAEAAKVAHDHGIESVRLYHTYPSPGPTMRYMGTVTAEGVFHDERRAVRA